MTIKDAVNKIKLNLAKNQKLGVDEDTYSLCQAIFSLDKSDILLSKDRKVTEEEWGKIEYALKRRLNGEPIQYIVGEWPFMDLSFYVGKGVLIPRDDTEVLIRALLPLTDNKPINALDLCSGSGIIAIMLKYYKNNINMTAVEKSKDAYYYLLRNKEKNNIQINCICDDLNTYADKIEDSSIDLLVSNPPYIKSDEIKDLQKEIMFEPSMALDGGKDGLDFYRTIIAKYKAKLKNNAIIAFEIGESQAEYISDLLSCNGFSDITVYKDIQDLDRAIIAKYALL